jgi:hypothetical protein
MSAAFAWSLAARARAESLAWAAMKWERSSADMGGLAQNELSSAIHVFIHAHQSADCLHDSSVLKKGGLD